MRTLVAGLALAALAGCKPKDAPSAPIVNATTSTPATAPSAPAAPSASATPTLARGDKAPDFSLEGSDGKTHALADQAGKQVTVIAWFPKAFTGG